MKNPVNDRPSHPELDGMTKEQIYEYIEFSPLDAVSEEVYDIGNDMLSWEHKPMFLGESYGRNIKGAGIPIGAIRSKGGWFHNTGAAKATGFRICRSKQ